MLLDFNNLVSQYNMNITGVIHIGGHYGSEYDEYCKYDSIQHMLFYEPNPDSFAKLEEKVGHDARVTVVNTALGPFSCEMDLYQETSNLGQSNSLLEPHLHKEQYPHIPFDGKIKVKVHPLDKYEPSDIFNFINIDVQGFELEVFRGAKKTLQHIDFIIAEVNKEELYKDCALVDELDEYLSKFNFNRVETKWITDTTLGTYRPKGETWGDALYVKNA